MLNIKKKDQRRIKNIEWKKKDKKKGNQRKKMKENNNEVNKSGENVIKKW